MSQPSTHTMSLRSQQHQGSQAPTWDDIEELKRAIQVLQQKDKDLSHELKQVKQEVKQLKLGTAATHEENGGDSKGKDSTEMLALPASEVQEPTEEKEGEEEEKQEEEEQEKEEEKEDEKEEEEEKEGEDKEGQAAPQGIQKQQKETFRQGRPAMDDEESTVTLRQESDVPKKVEQSTSHLRQESDAPKKVEESIASLKRELDNLNKDVESAAILRQEIDDLKKGMESATILRQEFDDLKKVMESAAILRQRLDDLRKDVESAASLRREFDDIKKDVESAANLQREFDDIKKEVQSAASLRRELDDIKKDVESAASLRQESHTPKKDEESAASLRQESDTHKENEEKPSHDFDSNSDQDVPFNEPLKGTKKEKVGWRNVSKVVKKLQDTVDAMLNRIKTLETQKSKLEAQISSMKTMMSEIPSAIKTQVFSSLKEESMKLKEWQTKTDTKLVDLKTKLGGITDQQYQDSSKLEHLEKQDELSSRAVSFHARLRSPVTTQEPTVLVCEDVVHNESGGYDNSTGFFTCPLSGTYCFLATASPNSEYDSNAATVEIVAERDVVGWLCAYGFRSSTAHSVVRLEKGERVCLRTGPAKPDFAKDWWTFFSRLWLGTAPEEHHFAGNWWTSFTGMLLKTGPERPVQD